MGHVVMKRAGTTLMALCTLVMFIQVHGALASGKAQQQAPPAIFVFGDNNVDVGNNNYMEATEGSEPVQANHPYYGIDFPKSKATGRFSNGYNLADFIAKAIGLKISPPAYLSMAGRINSMKGFTGVNYASAGAGIFNITNFNGVSIHLLLQVDYFAATKAQMKTKLGNSELNKVLSKSIFLLCIGTIDLYYIWDRIFYGNETNVHDLIASYEVGIKTLYNMGARKLIVINAPPMGSAPVMPYIGEPLNILAMEFNDGLKSLLASLSSKLYGLRYSIADFYGFSNATFMNPSAAGFVDTVKACCKGSCNPQAGPPCQNRKQYWFWDDLSITQQAANLAAAAFYDGPAHFTVPINFKKLVQAK
ncbi:hypothetical protein EJB05_30189, partial [Eragrostis curvula]